MFKQNWGVKERNILKEGGRWDFKVAIWNPPKRSSSPKTSVPFDLIPGLGMDADDPCIDDALNSSVRTFFALLCWDKGDEVQNWLQIRAVLDRVPKQAWRATYD